MGSFMSLKWCCFETTILDALVMIYKTKYCKGEMFFCCMLYHWKILLCKGKIIGWTWRWVRGGWVFSRSLHMRFIGFLYFLKSCHFVKFKAYYCISKLIFILCVMCTFWCFRVGNWKCVSNKRGLLLCVFWVTIPWRSKNLSRLIDNT
jgi:hypothetical protein